MNADITNNNIAPQTLSTLTTGETTAENLSQLLNEEKPRLVSENALCIHKNSWGWRVYVEKLTDGTYQKMAFLTVNPNGRISDTVIKKKSQLLKKNGFEFIYDLEGDFDKADLNAIKAGYKDVERKLVAIDCPDRSPFEQVYKGLYLCGNCLQADIITIDRDGDVEYLCIDTKKFDKLVKDEEWGWKALEVKKTLRKLGFLRINAGRPYDFAKRDKDGTLYRTISLRLDKALGEEAEA